MYEEFIKLTEDEAKKFNRDAGSVNWPHRKTVSEMIVKGTVLEVGCGNGIDAHLFNPKTYTGVDVSPALIKSAKEYNPDYYFKIIDATNLPYKMCSFDNVISIGLFEGQPNIEFAKRIFTEMIRVAKKKVLILWYKAPSERYGNVLQIKKGHFDKTCHDNRYNREEFTELISEFYEFNISHFDENYEIWEIVLNGS